jgi:hypothetical protein
MHHMMALVIAAVRMAWQQPSPIILKFCASQRRIASFHTAPSTLFNTHAALLLHKWQSSLLDGINTPSQQT